METKTDVRKYSDKELSLLVFNDEGLYLKRYQSSFLELVDDIFIYRPEQLEDLKYNLKADAARD